MSDCFYRYDKFKTDSIRAVDAKFEAQKIAFAPLAFQAVRAMLELGILRAISDAGDDGITRSDLALKAGVSEYGAGVLCEMALGMNVIKLNESSVEGDEASEKFVIGKIGWMLLEDDLTKANFNFVNDVCYKGCYDLLDSIKSGKPKGLEVFGKNWTTIYEALSSLPERAKKSWFGFDHFYSDIAFADALPIVFERKPGHIVDIGGNTARWAVACCKKDASVRVTIVDLPGQTAVARENARAEGFERRIQTQDANILSVGAVLPRADAYWMSQFLDCFSLHQIEKIMRKIFPVCSDGARIYVLEPLWDRQRFEGNAYSLQATSLYFTCMANGNSKMYRRGELVGAIEAAGFALCDERSGLGSNAYSLLVFKKA